MRNIVGKPLLAAAIVVASLAAVPAVAQVDCRVAEAIAAHYMPEVRARVERAIVGHEERISRRKTLRIDGINHLGVRGCELTLGLNAHLKRKIRRDADGWITLKAHVHSVSRDQVCVRNVRVTSVEFERTMNTGERWYRRAANRALPNDQCFGR